MKSKTLFLIFFFVSSSLLAQKYYKTTIDGTWEFYIANPLWLESDNNIDWIPSNGPGATVTNNDTVYIDSGIKIQVGVTINSGQIIVTPGNYLQLIGPLTNSIGSDGLLLQANSDDGAAQYLGTTSTMTATQEIYIAGGEWHLIGSPFDGTSTTAAFDGAWMQQFIGAGAWLWHDDDGFDNTMNRGTGYSIWDATSTTHTLSGTLTHSDVTFSNIPFVGQGFVLFSNPYPCGIAFNLDWGLIGISTTINVWDGTSGSYTEIHATDNTVLPVNQGFFIQTSFIASERTLNIESNKRTKDNTNNIYKSTSDELSPKQVHLSIHNINNDFFDRVRLLFNENANLSYSFDTDAQKMFGSDESPDLFIKTEDDVDVVIKGLDANQNSTLRMQLRPNVNAAYRITASEFTFDPTTVVLLEDLFTTDGPMIVDANLDYTFSSLAGDDESRFVIYVRPAVTGIDTPDADTQFTVFGSKDFVRILSTESNYKLSVYNLLGQKLVEKNNLEGNASIDLSAFKQTIVLVSIQSEKELISKKIQLK